MLGTRPRSHRLVAGSLRFWYVNANRARARRTMVDNILRDFLKTRKVATLGDIDEALIAIGDHLHTKFPDCTIIQPLGRSPWAVPAIAIQAPNGRKHGCKFPDFFGSHSAGYYADLAAEAFARWRKDTKDGER